MSSSAGTGRPRDAAGNRLTDPGTVVIISRPQNDFEETMTRRHSCVALVLLTCSAALSWATAIDYKTPDKNWPRGPIRWIMSDDEEKAFKALKSDEERAAFAKTFWEKRDPTPGTPANEFEEIFWKKVDAAEKGYKGISTPGALSDMGRAFLLLGPATKTEQDPRGRSIWTYEPDPVTGITEKFTLMFAPGTSAPLLLDKKTLEQYVSAHPETRGIGWKLPVAAATQVEEGVPTAAAATKTEDDQSPESQRQIPILTALLSQGKGPSDVPFNVSFDFYAAVDGTTLTAINVEAAREAARGDSDLDFAPFARLIPDAPDGKPVNLTGALPFVPAPKENEPAGGFIYQARHNLAPGSYTIAVVVEYRKSAGTMGTLIKKIEIPDYRTKELNLSSVSLLAGFSPLGTLAPDEQERGAGAYTVGSFRLVPRGNPALTMTEAFTFYYQVYNPTPDPATSKPGLEATCTFYLKDAAAGWKRYRPALTRALTGQVDLFSIDMKDLISKTQVLPAEFKMELKIVDKPGAKSLVREIPFTVRGS